ncbi:MAG: hypothetical protein HY531_03940 [Chloroflexi bacterium]|nr:hypothetical protein [Chloroflexota bacterium]
MAQGTQATGLIGSMGPTGIWEPLVPPYVSNVALLRLGALMAGGSLLAASATLLSLAGQFPHPGQQSLAALVTFLIGLVVLGGIASLDGKNPYLALPLFGVCTLLVIALPLARYIPLVYIKTYELDLESLFPPLWVYSLSIPILTAIIADLALSERARSAPITFLAASLLPATMLLLAGSLVIMKMAASEAFVSLPHWILLALAMCIGGSCIIVLGAVAASRGLVKLGFPMLLGTGFLLEVGSVFFYGGVAPSWLPDLFRFVTRVVDSPSLAVAAGTLPGMLTILLGLAVLNATSSRRAKPIGGI